MNADSIKIECEEDGFWMVVQLDEEIPLVTNEGRLSFRIHGIAPELLQEVKRTIGEWWAEGQAAKADKRLAFLCSPEDVDESGGARTITRRPDLDDHSGGAYDISDPKHPRYHSVHADLWDSRAGK